MHERSWPTPREVMAEQYRRASHEEEHTYVPPIGRAGYGHDDGYRGAYAERPEYWMNRGELDPPEPEGSGWPYPLHLISPEAELRHERALADRNLARTVDLELFYELGPGASEVSVGADDAVITLYGWLPHPVMAREAMRVARATPGVRGVRDRMRVG